MKKFFTYFSIMLTLLSMVGCKSWLDINTNPNYVPEAKIKSLLPSATEVAAFYDILAFESRLGKQI